MIEIDCGQASNIGPLEVLMLEKLLHPKEFAELAGVPLATVYKWNHEGTGPIVIRVGRHVRYRPSDVDAWIENRATVGMKTTSPSEQRRPVLDRRGESSGGL